MGNKAIEKFIRNTEGCLTPKVKWLFEQVQTPFRLLAFVSFYN